MVGVTPLILRKPSFIYVLAAALVFAVGAPATLAMKHAGNVVTGTLTASSNGDTLSLDGRTYRIKAGSPVAQMIRKVQKGTVLDVFLNGPPNTAASEVIGVVQHSGR